jgi:tripartite-type tricarboxylate transporter receptor subunit TctC
VFSQPPAPKKPIASRRSHDEGGRIPALEFSEWFEFAPSKNPIEIAVSLNGAVRDAIKADEFKSGLAKLSLEPAGSSMNEFAQRMRADLQRWEQIVKASGFVAE